MTSKSFEVHVYAGTAGHSAWFSDDDGETWVHPNSHSGMYLEARVWTLASDPKTPERLFAGTDIGAPNPLGDDRILSGLHHPDADLDLLP